MTTLLAPPPGLIIPDGEPEPAIADVEAAIRAADNEADLDALIGYLRARLAIGWRLSPSAMGAYLTGGVVRRWPYVELLSRQFVKAATGESPRQIWNLPSRYGKTLIAQWGVVWLLDATEGRARMMLVSWGDQLSRRKSVEIREMVRAHSPTLRFAMSRDLDQQDQWNTGNGGGLVSTGIDGGAYGFGAGGGMMHPELGCMLRGGILVDDPFRHWTEAERATRREQVWTQYRGTVRGRLDEEEAWIIVIQHRLHPDDLTGKIEKEMLEHGGEHYEIVSLPARAYDPATDPDAPPDPLGRKPGEPLEPERFTLEAVISRAGGYGPHLAAALEQQRPRSHAGTEILREWFVYVNEDHWPAAPSRAITSWDLKLKDREAGDYVVGTCWWAIGDVRYCVDMLRGQWDHPTTEVAIALLQVRHPEVKQNFVEAAGSADEVLPELQRPRRDYTVEPRIVALLKMTPEEVAAVERLMRQGMGNLKPEPVTQAAKPVRARLYTAPVASQGNLRLPAWAPWVPVFVDEHADFPGGMNDDVVDSTSQACKVLRKAPGGAGIAVPEGVIPG